MKKIKMKLLTYKTLIIFLGVLAIGGAVAAFSGQSKIVNENGTVNFYEAAETTLPIPVAEESLGAAPTFDIINPYLAVNDDRTYYETNKFINASTTIVSFADPFQMASTSVNQVAVPTPTNFGRTGATSTVEVSRLDISGVATSSYAVVCGAASSPWADPAVNILVSGSIASSSKDYLENNIASSTATLLGATATGATAKIYLTPQLPYFVCKVKHSTTYGTVAYPGSWTEATNTFDGNYSVRVTRPGK